MHTLRTLGGLRLENGSGPFATRATQRRRLAVLALLSLAPEKRVPRARLVGYLWPEVSEEQARARLSTTLYHLRRLLGDRAVLSEGDDIRLAPDAVRSDVEDLEDAVRRGDWERALRIYAGPFFDGVYVPDAPAFDEWASATRERIERLRRTILEQAATAREIVGDAAGVVERLRELHRLDPLELRTTRRLMEALAQQGDRSGAIRVADDSALLLRAELGAAPDADISAFADRLRAEAVNGAKASPTDAPPNGASSHVAALSLGTGMDRLAAAGNGARVPLSSTSGAGNGLASIDLIRRRRAVARGYAGLAGTLAVVLLATLAWARWRATPAASATTTTTAARRIAIIPFRTEGTSDTSLGRTIAKLIAASVDLTEGLVAVRPAPGSTDGAELPVDRAAQRAAAARLHADRFLMGTITAIGGRWRVETSLLDVATGNELSGARFDVAASEVGPTADDITRRIVATELHAPAQHLARAVALSNTPLAAMRSFLVGERYFRVGRFREAVKAYQAAVEQDSTLALAHYRISLATIWGNVPLASLALHDSLALLYSSRLGDPERALISNYIAWRRGDARTALNGYYALTARDMSDVEAWQQLGETAFHYNPASGEPIDLARLAFETVMQLDSGHWGARWHLALLDGLERGRAAFLAHVPKLLGAGPDSASALGVRLLAADSGPALEALAHGADEFTLLEGAWRRAIFLHDLPGAETLYREMLAPGHGDFSRAQGAHGLTTLALARGELLGARERASEPVPPSLRRESLTTLVQAGVLPVFAATPAELDAMIEAVVEWRARFVEKVDSHGPQVRASQTLEALLLVAKGDTTRALSLAGLVAQENPGERSAPVARQLLLLSRDERRQGEMTIRAFVSFRAGRYARALAQLDSAQLHQWLGDAASTPWSSQTFQRYLRAESLRALGRWQEAIAWYDTFEQYVPSDIALLGPVLWGRAAARAALGQRSAAAEDYRRFAELWQSADPPYASLRDNAERRAAELR